LSGLKAVIEPLNIRRVSFDLTRALLSTLPRSLSHKVELLPTRLRRIHYFNHRGLWQILINLLLKRSSW